MLNEAFHLHLLLSLNPFWGPPLKCGLGCRLNMICGKPDKRPLENYRIWRLKHTEILVIRYVLLAQLAS